MVLTSDSNVTSLFVFSHGVRLNMKVYIKCLEKAVNYWIEKAAAA